MQAGKGWMPISTGEEIRKRMVDPASDIGALSRPFMDRGDYVPDDLANRLFDEILASLDADASVVLDGYPRTVPQAERLTAWFNQTGHQFHGCLFLNIDPLIAEKRMQNRLVCPVCRDTFPRNAGDEQPQMCEKCGVELIPREDDDPERMGRRVRRHHQMTAPLREWYQARSQLIELDASQTPEDLINEILTRVSWPTPEELS